MAAAAACCTAKREERNINRTVQCRFWRLKNPGTSTAKTGKVLNIYLSACLRRRGHVLRALCAGQEGPAGPDLAGGALGQEADQGARLRDQHREVGRGHPAAQGERTKIVEAVCNTLSDLFLLGKLWPGDRPVRLSNRTGVSCQADCISLSCMYILTTNIVRNRRVKTAACLLLKFRQKIQV